MKTITINEFKDLTAGAGWKYEHDFGFLDDECRTEFVYNEEIKDFDLLKIPHRAGWAQQTSILNDIKIIYTETFSFDVGDSGSLVTDDGEGDFSIEGAVIIDEDGDEININRLDDYINNDFRTVDYSFIDFEEVIEID